MENKNVEISIIVRRGRPNHRQIIAEMQIAQNSRGETCKIFCKICKRIFPRKKAVQTHMRIHTGFAPYVCDYPGCDSRFRQSGHLKTHEKIHTHEKDFVCPVEGCNVRFAHSNRHCKDHPDAKLKRDGKGEVEYKENHTPEEREWLLKYEKNKGIPVKRKKTLDISAVDSASLSTKSKTLNISASQSYSVKRAKKCKTASNSRLSPAKPDLFPLDKIDRPENPDLPEKLILKNFDINSSVWIPFNFTNSSTSSPARLDAFPSDRSESIEHFKTSPQKCLTSSPPLSSSSSSPVRPDSFPSDISDRSESSEFSNEHSSRQCEVSYDSAQDLHCGNLPQNFYSGSIHTSVIMGRCRTVDEKTQSVRFNDKNVANPSHIQNATDSSDSDTNLDPKPIRTPVIQSTQQLNIKVQQADPRVLEAAETLYYMKTFSLHRFNCEQN